jgi:hypothetical protein
LRSPTFRYPYFTVDVPGKEVEVTYYADSHKDNRRKKTTWYVRVFPNARLSKSTDEKIRTIIFGI